MTATVCLDVGEAVAVLAGGGAAVLVVAPGVEVDRAALGAGGRLAVFVGDPADPVVREAAGEMASEVFGRPGDVASVGVGT